MTAQRVGGTFYINRACKNLTEEEKEHLEKAKDELKKLFYKE